MKDYKLGIAFLITWIVVTLLAIGTATAALFTDLKTLAPLWVPLLAGVLVEDVLIVLMYTNGE
jgi:hypothetical protein